MNHRCRVGLERLFFCEWLIGSLLLAGCESKDVQDKVHTQMRLTFDKMQGKVKMEPGDLLNAFYADRVSFIRVSPLPRTWATFPDVRLTRSTIFDDWLLDSDYLSRVILPELKARRIEVGLPSTEVVADGPHSLRGRYERKTRIRALVRRRIVTVDVDKPRVMRESIDEPWSLDWSALSKVIGARPSDVFVVFPIS